MFSFINWITSRKSIGDEEEDPLEIDGHEDFLDVGAYALWYLKNRGVDPFSKDNLDKIALLGVELETITVMFMGMEITRETKKEVKMSVEKVIEHVFWGS